MNRLGLVLVVSFLCVPMTVSPPSAAAQEDFRNLDAGRPLRVEDAYPIKFREWEWELGAGLAGIEGGALEGATVLELKTGLFRNAQFGLEVHAGLEKEDGVSASGVEEFGAHLLYNLNQEGRRSPAFSVRADVVSPGLGDVAQSSTSGGVTAMMTRTFGSVRAHVNSGYRWAQVEDGGEGWRAGLALDRTLGLTSRLVAGDVFVEVPRGEAARVWIELGTRLQLSKRAVLDAGVFSRVDEWNDGVPNVGFTVGLSRAFGLRRLVPLGAYPQPRLKE